MGFYQTWMGYAALVLFIVFLFLIFRRHKVGFIKFLAWTIPILLILGVFYLNFLPFGYSKEYTLKVDDNGLVISDSPRLFLQDSNNKTITTLSDLYSLGQINVVLKPRMLVRNANATIRVSGDDVYINKLDFKALNLDKENKSSSWEYFWDFRKEIPEDLDGSANYNKEKTCAYFNASNNETLSYPNSDDMFEDDSFVVYAEWMPEDQTENNQQIIGHFNWELWQNNDSVVFMVGRLVDKNGSMPSITYKIDKTTFFNQKHSVIGIYVADEKTSKGYIELWVDNKFAGRKNIANQTIWADYGGQYLSFGKSSHGIARYYAGCIYRAGFNYGKLKNYIWEESFITSERKIMVPISGTGKLEEIKIGLKQ